MGCIGRLVEHWAFSRRDRVSKPPLAFRSLGNFVHPTLPVSFGSDAVKWKQTCDGLTNNREGHS